MSERNFQKYYMRVKRANVKENDDDSSQKVSKNKSCINKESHLCSISDTLEHQIGIETVEQTSETESEPDSIIVHMGADISRSTANSIPLKSKLIDWAQKYNIPNNATSDLLKLLQNYVGEDLPLDARTLLHTARVVNLKEVMPGQYYHFGLQQAIVHILSSQQNYFKNINVLEINVNVDGLPLSKSSSSQVYPILISIVGEIKCVAMVGLYHGYDKPKNSNEFLYNFMQDAVKLTYNGLEANGKHFQVKIKAIICDAPAKSFVKCIRGHTGYSSCSKCYIRGSFKDKMYFREIDNLVLRTDEQFRAKNDEDHHTGYSILEEIPNLDMINSFPLDYMHLVCLGMVKKILYLLCFGTPQTKIPHAKVTAISQSLLNLSSNIPIEFNRKPRSLSDLKRWKATEFRQVLFYTGPIIFKKHLSPDRYLNFLCLHVAFSILSSQRHSSLLPYATELLKFFVKTFQQLYGITNTSHNVHNLLHIADDVKLHGPIDNFSAFEFENFLQSILKSLRKNEKPLQQIVKRYSEKIERLENRQASTNLPLLKHEHRNGPLIENCDLNAQQFKAVSFEKFTLKLVLQIIAAF
ncbi:hypothetical protein RN001_011284 [Aquatica leii]|uniref:Transposase domain-containing protein n=1 Tax=Aquatica leii TaxID=1421715 RepID=A0AAN7QI14_9COLE|nr:hypothetical protein RN001_011284 [Aquatica leii]